MSDIRKELTSLKKGQTLRIETKNGIIVGKLSKLLKTGAGIELIDPKFINGKCIGKFKVFYCQDIQNMHIESQQESTNAIRRYPKIIDEDNDEVNNSFQAQNKIILKNISVKQFENIQKSIQKCTYINLDDEKYFAAIEEISQNFVLAIHAENGNKGR